VEVIVNAWNRNIISLVAAGSAGGVGRDQKARRGSGLSSKSRRAGAMPLRQRGTHLGGPPAVQGHHPWSPACNMFVGGDTDLDPALDGIGDADRRAREICFGGFSDHRRGHRAAPARRAR